MRELEVLFYMAIMNTDNQEAIGIFLWNNYSTSVIPSITNAVGHHKWNWKEISQTEFETYKEFGFKVFEVPQGNMKYNRIYRDENGNVIGYL